MVIFLKRQDRQTKKQTSHNSRQLSFRPRPPSRHRNTQVKTCIVRKIVSSAEALNSAVLTVRTGTKRILLVRHTYRGFADIQPQTLRVSKRVNPACLRRWTSFITILGIIFPRVGSRVTRLHALYEFLEYGLFHMPEATSCLQHFRHAEMCGDEGLCDLTPSGALEETSFSGVNNVAACGHHDRIM